MPNELNADAVIANLGRKVAEQAVYIAKLEALVEAAQNAAQNSAGGGD